jgi:hypothetical protein
MNERSVYVGAARFVCLYGFSTRQHAIQKTEKDGGIQALFM